MKYKQLQALLKNVGIELLIAPTDEDQAVWQPYFFLSKPYKLRKQTVIGKQIFKSPCPKGDSIVSVVKELVPLLQTEGIAVDRYDVIEWPNSPDRYIYKLNGTQDQFTHEQPEVMNFGEHQ